MFRGGRSVYWSFGILTWNVCFSGNWWDFICNIYADFRSQVNLTRILVLNLYLSYSMPCSVDCGCTKSSFCAALLEPGELKHANPTPCRTLWWPLMGIVLIIRCTHTCMHTLVLWRGVGGLSIHSSLHTLTRRLGQSLYRNLWTPQEEEVLHHRSRWGCYI